MSNASDTLSDRIGGAESVAELVQQVYVRVLAGLRLCPFFENTSLEKLVRMQPEFFAAALDGPMGTGDPDLAKIHYGLGIGRKRVTLFVNHLILC